MNQEQVLAKVVEIIAEQGGVSATDLTPDTRMKADLGFDSLDIVETVMEVEEEFEISLQDEKVDGIESVRDVAEYVSRLLNERGAGSAAA